MIRQFRPRFYHYSYPETAPRRSVDWVTNACTRSINVEIGVHQFQVVWTKRKYLASKGAAR